MYSSILTTSNALGSILIKKSLRTKNEPSFFSIGLLAHMDQMRMDPKHQFAAQYVLSRAANERREREALLAAHLAMTTNMQPGLLSGHMTSAAAAHHMAVAVSTAATAANIGGGTASPSAHSDSSTRISTPMNTAAEMKVRT